MNRNRIKALVLCLLLLLTSLPMTALAAPSTVAIESQTNSSFDYLEYYKDDEWHDLNTPKHWIEQTGEVVYCVEHAAENPHGDTYVATSPDSVFSASTLSGLNSILMYGYPNNTPAGFTADEARQATANALRFWLSEQGEAESYDFTNRSENPNHIRAKSGYEHVLEWADELLNKARARLEMPHAVDLDPSPITMSFDGTNGYIGQVQVKLTNINSGYTLDSSSLPAGSKVSGFTGDRSETLTITLPASALGKSYTLPMTGSDTRSVDNITAYVPSDGSLQKTFLCATTEQVVVETSLQLTAPAYGNYSVLKHDENRDPIPGVVFSIYEDEALTSKMATATTDAEGYARFGNLPKLFETITTNADGYAETIDLPIGTYKVQEITAPVGFIKVDTIKTVTLTTDDKTTAVFEQTNEATEVTFTKTDATTQTPVSGATIEIYDASGKLAHKGETDADGKLTVRELPVGTYTFRETDTTGGYALNSTNQTFIIHEDGSIAGTTAFSNEPTKLVITKMDTYTGKPFADIAFTLKNAAGEIVKTTVNADGYRIPALEGDETFTVDENGQVSFLYLPIGTYTLVEEIPNGYIGEDSISIHLTGDHGMSTPLQLVVNNCPTGIKILKTDASTGKPIKGAGFRVKVKNMLGFDTLKFTKQADGSYFYDENGTEQDLMVNDNGEVLVLGVPLGAIWIEESIVPEGYFPVAARKAEITADTKATTPMEISIPNSRSVKLDLDNDWWEIPAIVLSILLAAGGAGWYVLVYRKKQQKIKKRVK